MITTSPRRSPAINWIWIIAQTWRETCGSIASTAAAETGRTGANSFAAVLPAFGPASVFNAWWTLAGMISSAAAPRNNLRIRVAC